MQTIPLTSEEKQKLQKNSFKGALIALIIVSVIGSVAYFIIATLDREMFFIAYFVWGIIGFILFAIGYEAYSSWRDLQMGTKKICQTHIVDKQHTITRSSSGTGGSRTTTTNHSYYFELEGQPRLVVSESQYDLFKQGQHIQIEKLSYSGALWNILLTTDSGETLPTEAPKNTHKQNILPTQIAWSPLEAEEIFFLNKKFRINILWKVLSVVWVTFVVYIPLYVASAFLYRWINFSSYQLLLIASCIALAYVMRNISRFRANYQKDLAEGVEISRLLLVDKEVVKGGGITYMLVFENDLRIGVLPHVYEKAENQYYYWVGKVKTIYMPLYLQDDQKQNKWKLYV